MVKKDLVVLFLFLGILSNAVPSYAFWMWTPESNKWVNPKYSVKETPQEQLEVANEYFSAKEYKEALKEYGKLLKHYPRAKEAPEAQFFIAKCYQSQGFLFKAFESYQKVIKRYPFSERSAEIVEIEYNIAIELLAGDKKKNKFVETFSGNNYDPIDILKTVIKNAPYGKYAPIAQYKIALYLLEKKLYQESRDEFEKVMNDYPDSEWSRAAQYQIALADASRSSSAQYDQKITQAAVKELREFAVAYPDAEFSDGARERILELRDKEAENSFVIAQFYEKQKKYVAAKIYYQSVVDEYKDTKWAIKALNSIQALMGRE